MAIYMCVCARAKIVVFCKYLGTMEMMEMEVLMMLTGKGYVDLITQKLSKWRYRTLQRYPCKQLEMHCVAMSQRTHKKPFEYWISF